MFLIGIADWEQARDRGPELIRSPKIVLNEFVAFIDLGAMQGNELTDTQPRGIITFALCGFANFSSIGDPDGGDRRAGPQPGAR